MIWETFVMEPVAVDEGSTRGDDEVGEQAFELRRAPSPFQTGAHSPPRAVGAELTSLVTHREH